MSDIRRLLLVVLVASACTTGGSPSQTTEPFPTTTSPTPVETTTTLLPEVATGAFITCLQEQGVEVPELVNDANGRPRLDLVLPDLDLKDPGIAIAYSGCASLLGAGPLVLESTDPLNDLVMERLRGFADCMRLRGVESFPDPIHGFIGIGDAFPEAEIPYTHPAYESAVTRCSSELIESLN